MSERIFFQILMFLGFKLSNDLQFAPKREKLFSKYLFPEPSLEPTVEKDSFKDLEITPDADGMASYIHSANQIPLCGDSWMTSASKFNHLISVTFMQIILTIICFWFAPIVDVISAPPLPSSLSISPSLSLNGSPEFPTSWQRQSDHEETKPVPFHCAFETPETGGIFNSPAWQQLLNLAWISDPKYFISIKSS